MDTATNSLQLSEQQKSILEKFRLSVSDLLQPHHDDRYLSKWLIARNYSLNNAEKMIRDHFKFRKEIHLENLLKTKGLREDMLYYSRYSFLGFNTSGHSVSFYNFGKCDIKGFSRSFTSKEWGEFLCHLLESDVQRLRKRNGEIANCTDTGIFLVDTKDLYHWEIFDKEVIKFAIQALQILQDNYPEYLETIYFVRAPTIFCYFFNILKPFMNENTLSKFKIFGEVGWQEEVFSSISKSIVPAYLGGTREEPDGDPYCNAILSWSPKIPKSMYLENKCIMSLHEPGVDAKTLLPKSMFEISKTVTETPSSLSWEFQTKRHDLKFGLYFENASIPSERPFLEELICCKVVDCHKIAEKGNHICEDRGKYILRFDNSYSWFTSKYLLYKTDVNPI